MHGDPYDRQRRLGVVGDRGQARIEASTAKVAAGPGDRIALTYLVRAGVLHAAIEPGPSQDFCHEEWFEFAGARAVAAGAGSALAHLRRALELE
jgi:hypothetical protein